MKRKLTEKNIHQIKNIVIAAFEEIDYHKDFEVYFTKSAYDDELDIVIEAKGLLIRFDEYGYCYPTYGCFTEDEEYAIDLIRSKLTEIKCEVTIL